MAMEEGKLITSKENTQKLLWLPIFEGPLLKDYPDILKDWRRLWKEICYPSLLIISSSLLVWLAGVFLVINFDLPTQFPDTYTGSFFIHWKGEFLENFSLLIRNQLPWLFVFILLELFIRLFFGLDFARTGGVGFSIVFISAFVFAFDMKFVLIFILVSSLVFVSAQSSEKGLPFGLLGGLIQGLIFGLAGGLSGGLTFGLGGGLIVGITFAIGFIVIYFRGHLLLGYIIRHFIRPYSLEKNPHLKDWAIAFPIPGLQHHLAQEAVDDPHAGQNFADYLLIERSYQDKLAYCLLHAAFAGRLRQKRLNFQVLYFPELPNKAKNFKPTSSWYSLLQQTKNTLCDAEMENNIHSRLRYWGIFRKKLREFKAQTILEPQIWSKYYIQVLEKWEKSAAERQAELELEAQNAEPICRNIYRGGEKLDPHVDKRIFLGRDDLRDSFKNKVLTAQSMPLFFIQGQRRVGKSSLINFLPEFLGSGFVVIQYNMQEEPGGVIAWLKALQYKIYRTILPMRLVPPWIPSQNWVDAWKGLRAELEELAAKDGRRFVLAIDEYETLHGYLQKDPEQGDRLLSAIRSFSQGQNQVVLLFAGADFFSELKAPNWNEYFPQAVTLYVDYLKKPDAFQLIQAVELHYPPELLEEMYEQTQGHPALLQKICQEIVTIANTEGKRDITAEDFQRVLTKHILRPVNGVTDVFWGQFCELRGLQPAVRQIINGEEITDQRALLQMEDHGFIVEKEGRWQLRVPIFEKWVERYSWRDHPDR